MFSLRSGLFAALVATGLCGAVPVLAQDQPAADDQAAAAQQQPTEVPWASRCVSEARASQLDCTITQRAVTKQGQLVGSVTIRPISGNSPVMIVSVPLGFYLGAGVTFDVDGVGASALALQTCDRTGCYAEIPLNDAALNAMRAGQKLNINFQNMNKQTVTLPMSLIGFTAAFDKVK